MDNKRKFVWDEKYSVGVKELDTQRKIILKLINKMFKTETINVHSKELIDVLIEAFEYFHYHLNMEEHYLKIYNYPQYEEHVKEHHEFRKKISYFNFAQSKRLESIPKDLLTFLIEWWDNHVLKSDMQYKQFFQKKGVE